MPTDGIADFPTPLIAAADLADRLGAGRLEDQSGDDGMVILDASWHMPGSGRSARDEYEAEHLPGALFFDLDAHSDPDARLPHMFPPFETFADQLGALGIDRDRPVVVYDSHGLFSAARAWWMLGVMGHERAAVLDGGLPVWRRCGLPLRSSPPPPPIRARYAASPRPERVYDRHGVAAMLKAGRAAAIVDARSPDRFNGLQPEPRPDLRAGHIPGSSNIAFPSLLDESGRFLPDAELRRRFAALEGEREKTIVTTCGSGVTAAIVTLGLMKAGYNHLGLYDGSWSEWGASADLPVATAADS